MFFFSLLSNVAVANAQPPKWRPRQELGKPKMLNELRHWFRLEFLRPVVKVVGNEGFPAMSEAVTIRLHCHYFQNFRELSTDGITLMV